MEMTKIRRQEKKRYSHIGQLRLRNILSLVLSSLLIIYFTSGKYQFDPTGFCLLSACHVMASFIGSTHLTEKKDIKTICINPQNSLTSLPCHNICQMALFHPIQDGCDHPSSHSWMGLIKCAQFQWRFYVKMICPNRDMFTTRHVVFQASIQA